MRDLSVNEQEGDREQKQQGTVALVDVGALETDNTLEIPVWKPSMPFHPSSSRRTSVALPLAYSYRSTSKHKGSSLFFLLVCPYMFARSDHVFASDSYHYLFFASTYFFLLRYYVEWLRRPLRAAAHDQHG